ncbi:MAG: pyroglutamyl-peptidase I [Roseibium album]|uniref:Pyrrolidone-carboxylate peptidase n=1 Tax=Roseibium album TaxID=311410 RepID=A0A0M6ZFA3_9HYPH|nr:pyroglutamyl-peptidase I [Roseibium album]CTQ60083.1 Pyrrolidone-carboxylate peptidase [Roseibium album]CTQ77304.1 Pyrrolidone-carboxylate peptidase [Roseibium album]CTQ77555.1 Pyrrolidone-carboxylate peptidase [Roseibium album]
MKTILLTGFEAFGTTPVNPAEKVARHLDGETVEGARIVSSVIPNTFFVCIDAVKAAMAQSGADAVVMMGEFGGRATITVERFALNFNDATRYGLKDNAGVSLQDKPTALEGPLAYQSTLPLRAMVKAMRDGGIPADISDAAGTFCCNHLFYGVLHHLAQTNRTTPAGWIHLPHLPEVAAMDANLGAPSMSVETAAAGLRLALSALVKHPQDIDDAISGRLQI